ncbi:MAG: VOC family protein [Rhodospirillales bacterium]|jgi:catechol 2,3-dioxygenase-like lactoylglutathione lyase family enzyme
MPVQKLHHVVYRCNDAKETAAFYTDILELEYAMAVSEDHVPSTGEQTPYFHLFFEMKDGSSVAFFELPASPPMQKDPNTPDWVQHLALEVESEEELFRMKKKIEDAGVDIIGPTDHGFCTSIYFFDPNGHRLELTHQKGTPEMMAELRRTARPMLEKWDQSKDVQRDAAWIHKNA